MYFKRWKRGWNVLTGGFAGDVRKNMATWTRLNLLTKYAPLVSTKVMAASLKTLWSVKSNGSISALTNLMFQNV